MHKTMATSNATPPPTPSSMANFFDDDDDVTLSTAVSLYTNIVAVGTSICMSK